MVAHVLLYQQICSWIEGTISSGSWSRNKGGKYPRKALKGCRLAEDEGRKLIDNSMQAK